MKFLKWGAAGLVALVALVFAVGLLAPAEHEARCRIELPASPPEAVWALVGDIAGWSEWNSLVDRMEPRTSEEGVESWTMVSEWGEMPARVEAREPLRRLEVHLDGGDFEGYWRYAITPGASGGSTLEITETGRLSNPLMRAIGLFMDEHESMRTCMTDLAAKLGEKDAKPENIAL